MRQCHHSYLVSDDEVGVDGGAGPAHDGDEHGEGGGDQIHVQDQRNLSMELMSLGGTRSGPRIIYRKWAWI